MDEQAFYRAVDIKSKEYNLNPLLLLSGIEGLYSFKDISLNALNFQLLDNLILSIFALRIGDSFHSIAEKNISSSIDAVRKSATIELMQLGEEDIANSSNLYLQSFASVIGGKAIIRKYHIKALDVAALEIGAAHKRFENTSIGNIILGLCLQPGGGYDFSNLFSRP